MPCIFCDSFSHSSEYCPTYSSEEFRKDKHCEKNYCEICVLPWETEIHDWQSCNSRLKCYICFCRHHHPVFCPGREASKMFLPKIDADLFPRFSSIVNLIPINVYADALHSLNYVNKDAISVFDGEIRFHQNQEKNIQRFVEGVSSKLIINTAAVVSLQDLGFISKQDFWHFLTPFVKRISLRRIKFQFQIRFAEIIEKIPNVQNICFDDSNITITNSWPEELMKFKNGKNFQRLELPKVNLFYDYGVLAQFMKTKCSKNAFICLDSCFKFVLVPPGISQYFVEVDVEVPPDVPLLQFSSSSSPQKQRWFKVK